MARAIVGKSGSARVSPWFGTRAIRCVPRHRARRRARRDELRHPGGSRSDPVAPHRAGARSLRLCKRGFEMNVLEVMRVGPVIPVIIIDELKQAVPLAKALVAGGVRVLEVTLRTPVALEAIRAIASEVGEAIIGVGTISRPEDFVEAAAAGARLGVSPGLTPSLIDGARASGLPLLPGVMTRSEVIAARAAGFTELKWFL